MFRHFPRKPGKRPGRRGALDHDHNGDDRGKAQNFAEIVGIDVGQRDMRRRHRKGSDGPQSLVLKAEGHGRNRRAHQGEERAGQAPAQTFGDDDHGEAGKSRQHGQGLGPACAHRDLAGALKETARTADDPEKRRGLGKDNMHGDAAEKTRKHGNREQIRNPTGAKKAGAGEDQPDHKRKQRRQGEIFRSGGRNDGEQRGRENRGDGRICAGGKKAVGAEKGESERSRDENVKPDMGREAAQPRRRHLFRRGDRGKSETRHEIGAPTCRPGLKRAEKEPVFPVLFRHENSRDKFWRIGRKKETGRRRKASQGRERTRRRTTRVADLPRDRKNLPPSARGWSERGPVRSRKSGALTE